MGADHVRFQIARAIGPCTLKPDGGPHPTSFIANAKPKTTLVNKNYIIPRHYSRLVMTKTQEENFIEIPRDMKKKQQFIK